MASDDRPLIDGDFTREDWLNAVRNEAGHDYQSKIPEATQANVQDVIQSLWNYKPQMNQFIDVLVNRIGLVIFQEWSWSNPLAPLKRGMLQWGETIEEIMVGLIEADEYDADRDELEKELFGTKTPEVQVSYHTVNRRNRYKLTVKEPLLRNAFLSDTGFNNFIGQLLGVAQKSDQRDEFLLMANLFNEMDTAAKRESGAGLFNVNINDIGDQDSTADDSRYALRRMREFNNILQFPSRMYNPAGMEQAVNPDDLILFTTPEARAAMDVEALAGAFNIDKADFSKREFILPKEHYGIPGFQAAITTKEFFVVADQRIDTTSLYNPAALFTNYWLHHWQVISASKNAPLVMFNSERESTTISRTNYVVSDITDFAITDREGVAAATNVQRGEFYNVAVQAVTTPLGGPGIAVRYDVEGALSEFTRVTNNGTLFVALDESADTLTIRATAVDSRGVPQMSETTSRGVVGDYISPWPHPAVEVDADNDGTPEVTPAELEMVGGSVTIPTVTGVQYLKDAVNVNNGTVHVIAAETVFTAVARSGYELAAGAPTTWTFDV